MDADWLALLFVAMIVSGGLALALLARGVEDLVAARRNRRAAERAVEHIRALELARNRPE